MSYPTEEKGRCGYMGFPWPGARRVPAAQVCSAEVTARVAPVLGGQGAPCEVFVIGGVSVRVTTELDPERGEVKTATRLLAGGMLAVISQQGLAAIAAYPAMLT